MWIGRAPPRRRMGWKWNLACVCVVCRDPNSVCDILSHSQWTKLVRSSSPSCSWRYGRGGSLNKREIYTAATHCVCSSRSLTQYSGSGPGFELIEVKCSTKLSGRATETCWKCHMTFCVLHVTCCNVLGTRATSRKYGKYGISISCLRRRNELSCDRTVVNTSFELRSLWVG